MMEIGIDITHLFWKYRTGVQNYYHGLVEGLASIAPERGNDHIILIDRNPLQSRRALLHVTSHGFEYRSAAPRLSCCQTMDVSGQAGASPSALRRFHDRCMSLVGNSLAIRLRGPRALLDDLDVFEVWPWDIKKGPSRNVILAPDVIPLLFPKPFKRHFVKAVRAGVDFARDEADVVIAISEYTKQDLVRVARVPPEKIRVIYPGVGDNFRREENSEVIGAVRRKYGIGDAPYILSVGFLDPRKNVVGHIRAFEALCLGERVQDIRLVLVGPATSAAGRLRDAAKNSQVRDRILLTGYAPAEDLPALYTAASVFVYCSLYEGFGIPVLEALACGTPVVTSTTTSLPEACGDAGLLADPEKPEEIAAAILRLLRDSDLRRDLTARGLARAKQLTWEKCAREHLEAYRSVAPGSGV